MVFLFGVYSFLWYENLESEHYVICAICCSSLDYQERKIKTPERVAFTFLAHLLTICWDWKRGGGSWLARVWTETFNEFGECVRMLFVGSLRKINNYKYDNICGH